MGTESYSSKTFYELLLRSPTARSLDLTERVVLDFFLAWETKHLAADAKRFLSLEPLGKESPRTTAALRGRLRTLLPLSSPRDSAARTIPGERYTHAQFLSACEQLREYSEGFFKGTCIVGNGRSVLAYKAGPMVDRFETVLRFNDYQIDEYEEHIGRKTTLWVVSDWTCIKLLAKYPERTGPVLCAIPYMFMGNPYYEQRRKEVEDDLTPAQRQRVRS